jgi:hypothetical protein
VASYVGTVSILNECMSLKDSLVLQDKKLQEATSISILARTPNQVTVSAFPSLHASAQGHSTSEVLVDDGKGSITERCKDALQYTIKYLHRTLHSFAITTTYDVYDIVYIANTVLSEIRVYASLIPHNIGNDPRTSVYWIEVNRKRANPLPFHMLRASDQASQHYAAIDVELCNPYTGPIFSIGMIHGSYSSHRFIFHSHLQVSCHQAASVYNVQGNKFWKKHVEAHRQLYEESRTTTEAEMARLIYRYKCHLEYCIPNITFLYDDPYSDHEALNQLLQRHTFPKMTLDFPSGGYKQWKCSRDIIRSTIRAMTSRFACMEEADITGFIKRIWSQYFYFGTPVLTSSVTPPVVNTMASVATVAVSTATPLLIASDTVDEASVSTASSVAPTAVSTVSAIPSPHTSTPNDSVVSSASSSKTDLSSIIAHTSETSSDSKRYASLIADRTHVSMTMHFNLASYRGMRHVPVVDAWEQLVTLFQVEDLRLLHLRKPTLVFE